LGTGANTLAFNSMLRSWNAILCSDMAHTCTTESGAVEAIVGCKMLPIPSVHGKIQASDIVPHLANLGSQHQNQPRVVALTQATEVGTLYTPEELRAITETAHQHGLYVHMDGARIANATAALGGNVRALTRDLGVDVLSFGGTKNGMMMGEAVVFFNREFAHSFPTMRKQCLQLASKMRFFAAQFISYFKDDLWLENARHANKMARLLAGSIADLPYITLAHPVETNGVFVNMQPEHIAALQQDYAFHEVDPVAHTARWMLSFNTTEQEVLAFIEAIRKL
ncbi:MAG: beta-eliminating lyase-related protein, partial [Bilophila sp.]